MPATPATPDAVAGLDAAAVHLDAVLGYVARRIGVEPAIGITGDVLWLAVASQTDDAPLPLDELLALARTMTRGRASPLRLLRQRPAGGRVALRVGVVVRGISQNAALDALDRLRWSDQELLRLAQWEELAPEEIAATLGWRTGRVRRRLEAATRRLARAAWRIDPAGRGAAHAVMGALRDANPVPDPSRLASRPEVQALLREQPMPMPGNILRWRGDGAHYRAGGHRVDLIEPYRWEVTFQGAHVAYDESLRSSLRLAERHQRDRIRRRDLFLWAGVMTGSGLAIALVWVADRGNLALFMVFAAAMFVGVSALVRFVAALTRDPSDPYRRRLPWERRRHRLLF